MSWKSFSKVNMNHLYVFTALFDDKIQQSGMKTGLRIGQCL